MKYKILFCFTFLLLATPVFSANPYLDINTSPRYLKHVNRAYFAMDQENYPLAIKEFITARYIDDELFAAHEGLGKLFEKTKKYKKAVDNYEKALNVLSPSYANSYIKKIRSLRKNKEYKRSLYYYKRVLTIRPEAGIQMMIGDQSFNKRNFKKAAIHFQRAYTIQEMPEKYFKLLDVKYPNKDFELFLYRRFKKENMGYSEAHFKAGLSFYNSKNYSKAINEFKLASEKIDTKKIKNEYIRYLALSYYNLGISSKTFDLKQLDKSIEYLEDVIDEVEDNFQMYLDLANSYYYRDLIKMKSFDIEEKEAEKDFKKVAKYSTRDPEYIDAKDTLFDVLDKKYNTNFFDRTINIYNRLDKTNKLVLFGLGNAYFNKALIFQKGYYDRHEYNNSSKARARDRATEYFEKALNNYKKYVDLYPKEKKVYYDIGLMYYYRSQVKPNKEKIPINKDNFEEYQRWGEKFYKRDMLNRSLANFNIYLYYYPRSEKSNEVRALMQRIRNTLIYI